MLRQPAAEVSETHDVVPAIVHQGWQQHIGNPDSPSFRQNQETILRHRRVERGASRLPIGEELIESDGIEHRPGEDVGADLGPLFDDADGVIPALRLAQLAQPDRSGKSRRARSDDQHIEPHDFLIHRSEPTAPMASAATRKLHARGAASRYILVWREPMDSSRLRWMQALPWPRVDRRIARSTS